MGEKLVGPRCANSKQKEAKPPVEIGVIWSICLVHSDLERVSVMKQPRTSLVARREIFYRLVSQTSCSYIVKCLVYIKKTFFSAGETRNLSRKDRMLSQAK